MIRRKDQVEPAIVRAAERAWFRAGVRRGDRRRLRSDLLCELAGAREGGDPAHVLGDDPGTTAREWAAAQGLTDRRTRIALLAPSMVVAGFVASGGVVVPLLQAFGNGGRSFMDNAGVPMILGIYCAAGLLAYVAMLAVSVALLSVVADMHRNRTVRVLSLALPFGGVIACAGAVASAATLRFQVRPLTFTTVGLVVAGVLMATVAAARFLITRYEPMERRQGGSSAFAGLGRLP